MNEISLLFAIEAEQLLKSGFPEEAIYLCIRGLEAYPEYSAAYSILAESYFNTGNFNKAMEAVEKALHFNPNNQLLISLKEKLIDERLINDALEDEIVEDVIQSCNIPERDIKESSDGKETESADILDEIVIDEEMPHLEPVFFNGQEQGTDISQLADFGLKVMDIFSNDNTEKEVLSFEESEINNKPDQDIKFEKKSNSKFIRADTLELIPGLTVSPLTGHGMIPIEIKPVCSSDPFDTYFFIPKSTDNISNRIRKTEIPNLNFEADDIELLPVHGGIGIISETLASIYESQGAFNEAIEAYTELMDHQPDKSKYFQQKIDVLKKKLK